MNILIGVLFFLGSVFILLEVFNIIHLDWVLVFSPFLLMLGIYIYLTIKDVYEIIQRDKSV